MAYIDNGDGTASSDNNWPSDYVECWQEQQSNHDSAPDDYPDTSYRESQSNYDRGIGNWRTAND